MFFLLLCLGDMFMKYNFEEEFFKVWSVYRNVICFFLNFIIFFWKILFWIIIEIICLLDLFSNSYFVYMFYIKLEKNNLI